MNKSGKITQLLIFTEKGQPGTRCQSVIAIAGSGLEGDRHADGGDRQISILDRDVRVWMDACREPGLCFRRFKENLQIDGDLVAEMEAGDILAIGSARLRVTGCSKRCFPECSLFRAGKECRLHRGNAWAEVVETGTVSVKDETILIKEYRN